MPVLLLALLFMRLSLREKAFIAWAGLRGAAPIVLATFPLLAGVGEADLIFHLVFFIVLTSVLLQGALIVPVSRWLRVNDDSPQAKSPLAYVMQDGAMANDLLEIAVESGAPAVGRQLVELHQPPEALVMLVGRADEMIVLRGSTIIAAGDTILLMADKQTQPAVLRLFRAELVPEPV